MRKLTKAQEDLLNFIRRQAPCEDRAIRAHFALRGSDWLTIRNRLEGLEDRGLITRSAGERQTWIPAPDQLAFG